MFPITKLFYLVFTVLLVFSACSREKSEAKTITVKESDIVLKSLGVNGMTCVGCEVTLEGAVSKIDGVLKVKASAATDSAKIEYDKSKTDEETISKAIQELGYKVK